MERLTGASPSMLWRPLPETGGDEGGGIGENNETGAREGVRFWAGPEHGLAAEVFA
jgi:hypothetical protein